MNWIRLWEEFVREKKFQVLKLVPEYVRWWFPGSEAGSRVWQCMPKKNIYKNTQKIKLTADRG